MLLKQNKREGLGIVMGWFDVFQNAVQACNQTLNNAATGLTLGYL